MSSKEEDALLAAYIDDRLDAAGVADLGRRLAAEPELAADLVALVRTEYGCRRLLRTGQADTEVITLRRRLAAPRRRQATPRRVWPWAAAAGVLLAFGALWWAQPGHADRFVATTATVVEAAPGVQAELAPGSDLRVIYRADPERGTRLELDAGAAWFEVAPVRDGHPVVVATADLEAKVVGTRFQVERAAAGSRVTVERGTVAVRGADGAARMLTAGETFRSDLLRSFRWTPGDDAVVVRAGTLEQVPRPAVLAEVGKSQGMDHSAVLLAPAAGSSLFACDSLPVLEVEIVADPSIRQLQAVVVLYDEHSFSHRGNLIATVQLAPGGGVQRLRFAEWPDALAVPVTVRPAFCTKITIEHFGSAQPFRLLGLSVAPR